MRRRMALRVAVIAVIALLAGRLWQIQVAHGHDYRLAAEQNRVRLIRQPAARGAIYDRRGRILATSRQCLDVVAVPEELAGRRDALAQTAALLQQSPTRIVAALKNRTAPFEEVALATDVPLAMATRVAEASTELHGLSLRGRPVRCYPGGALAAHVLGYVREIDAEELARRRDEGYDARDRVGKAGIERVLETVLRGSDGGEQIEVDARGKLMRVLGKVDCVPGATVTLNLDAEVQRTAERLLSGRRGAAVVMDPRNGELLALASSPAFNPNAFSGRLTRSYWAYLNGRAHPQQNRTADALFEPGSVFKIITATAALEGGSVGPTSRFYCPGYYRLGTWTFRCGQRAGHGSLDLISGFAKSCNVMFIRLGRMVGRAGLERWARTFGLGAKTGVDLPDENSGLVPTPSWKRRRMDLPWYPGDTCQMSVGQGGTLVTPLQAAVVTAAIANGGYRVTPRLVRAVDGRRVSPEAPQALGLRPATAAVVREGMAAVVRRGTASAVWDPQFPLGGKTGTAQNPQGKPHAWFVGFAPVESPRAVVAVVLEQGGSGAAAAPLGAAMLRAALKGDDRRAQPPAPTAP